MMLYIVGMVSYKTELIEKFLAENNLCKTKFCKQCRIGLMTLKRIYRNDLTLRVGVLLRIADILGILPSELLTE